MDQNDRTSEEIVRVEEAPVQRTVFDELIPPENPRVRYIVAAVAVLLALVSFFGVAAWAGSAETYTGIIASLDEVMQLVTGSTATSAGITLLPGDVGTPIAEKLLDLGADFAIVIGAIYLEKYALTILGLAAYKFLVPVGCIMFAIAAMLANRPSLRQMLFGLSARLVLFGIAISLVVPASVMVSNLIEDTYETSMNETIAALEQTDDVEKSKRELQNIIEDLTKSMSEKFLTQFHKINEQFKISFSDFFGGGKGELILENPDECLESPIEIKIQPPGKSVQNINLFSGGEKSLAAMALLFSVLKVTPSPFCIYDEVEAALDDVNVERFAKYMRKMTDKTQFISITHRRGTMEEADVLYGVTMQEKGVSKLLELQSAELAEKMGLE